MSPVYRRACTLLAVWLPTCTQGLRHASWWVSEHD